MPAEFPPTPSKREKIALAVVGLVTLLYSILVVGQFLSWFLLVGLAVGLYLTYLLIVVLFRLVEAIERIATAAEVDSGIRTVAETEASSNEGFASASSGEGFASDSPNDGFVPEPPTGERSAEGSDPDTDGASSDSIASDEPSESPDADGSDPDDGTGSSETRPDEANGSRDPDGRTDGG